MSRTKSKATLKASSDSLIPRRAKAFYLVRVERFGVDHPSSPNTVSLQPMKPSCHCGKWERDGIKNETYCVKALKPEAKFIHW